MNGYEHDYIADSLLFSVLKFRRKKFTFTFVFTVANFNSPSTFCSLT